ncbi:MAG: hypothetical protein P8Z38_08965 [Robiginitalea sp.]
MKKLLYLLIAVGAAVSLATCSSDSDEDEQSDTGPAFAISELQGTWTATTLNFSYSEAGERPDPDFAAIINEGGSASMTVQSSGQFVLTIDPVDRGAMMTSGRMFFEDGEYFAIEFDGEAGDYEYFGATLSGNTFTINGGPNTVEYDLDLDGSDELCSVYLVLVRS